MPGYTPAQVSALQGYINAAQTALAQGNYNGVTAALNSYYGAQTGMRGYAQLALDVVNNTGVDGIAANNDIINAIGTAQYTSIQSTLQVQLASDDFRIIQGNPNSVPSSNQIANYHYTDFNNLGIPTTAWGGATGAALGTDWSQGQLTSAELDSDATNNLFYQNFSAAQTQTALAGFTQAGEDAMLSAPYTLGNLNLEFNGALTVLGYQSLYNQKYGLNYYVNPINYNGSGVILDPITVTDFERRLAYD